MKISTLGRAIIFRVALVLVLVAGIASLPGGTARAIPSSCGTVVTNNSDSGIGSLRWAVGCISGGGGTITFDPSLSGQTITLTSGEILTTYSMTIDGSALSTPVSVSGNNASRIFVFTSAVTLDSLIIKDGMRTGVTPAQGGAILNQGVLTLVHMTFTNNHTVSSQSEGGAIYNDGTLKVENSTFKDNSATSIWSYGGAIYNNSILVVENSTFSGNSVHSDSDARGGAIYNSTAGSVNMNVTNSTFSGNTALVGVSSIGQGGGIYNAAGGAASTLKNTIVAGSGAAGGNCAGNLFVSSLNNLDDDESCIGGFTTSGDINLGTLGNYGGPTQTIALLSGSSAIDTGSDTDCAASVGSPNYGAGGKDQRGAARPQGAGCDIGAFEYGPIIPLITASTPAANASVTNLSTITVTFNQDMLNDGSSKAANSISNYLLVEQGANKAFDTQSCKGGIAGDDVKQTISNVIYANPVSILTLANPLAIGNYRLFVCGTTSIWSAAGLKLNNGANDATVDFIVNAATTTTETGNTKRLRLPGTGFTPNIFTTLPSQPAYLAYQDLGSVWLEIPSLNVSTNIVGVPQSDNAWDVKWLGNDAGWLNGTAFPTWVGNSVITSHVTDSNGQPGPFVNLKDLKYGDQIIVHLYGEKYIFEVRNSRMVRPSTTNFAFEHLEGHSYLTLITCQGYNPFSNSYLFRRVIRSVLVEVK